LHSIIPWGNGLRPGEPVERHTGAGSISVGLGISVYTIDFDAWSWFRIFFLFHGKGRRIGCCFLTTLFSSQVLVTVYGFLLNDSQKEKREELHRKECFRAGTWVFSPALRRESLALDGWGTSGVFFGKCVLRIMPEQGNGSLGTIAELVYLHRLYFASGSVLRRKYTGSSGGFAHSFVLFVPTRWDKRFSSSHFFHLSFFVTRKSCERRKHEFV
jgi:hypothetical protein